MSDIKQVIVMRTDLNMPKGKLVAQGSHASMSFMTRRLDKNCCWRSGAQRLVLSEVEQRWLDESFVKVCLKVASEEELLAIRDTALAAKIECHLVTDNGLTMFNGVPTNTCVALGPDFSNKIDPITGHLRLL